MITIGEKLPEATLMESTEFGEACPLSPKPVNTVEAAKGKRIVVFGLPGAYTPTCSAKHVPGYVANLDALKARGIDEIWCVSVNDGYVMAAWGRDQDAIGKIRMLGDGNAELDEEARPRERFDEDPAWASARGGSRCSSTTASSSR